MPPKKDTKAKPSGSGAKKETKGKEAGEAPKKESKGGTSVKVRHILCEKQVCFLNVFWFVFCHVVELMGRTNGTGTAWSRTVTGVLRSSPNVLCSYLGKYLKFLGPVIDFFKLVSYKEVSRCCTKIEAVRYSVLIRVTAVLCRVFFSEQSFRSYRKAESRNEVDSTLKNQIRSEEFAQ